MRQENAFVALMVKYSHRDEGVHRHELNKVDSIAMMNRKTMNGLLLLPACRLQFECVPSYTVLRRLHRLRSSTSSTPNISLVP